MDLAQATQFATEWLEAWTGNEPEKLLGYYAANAKYHDPANPHGLFGHSELKPYFTRLLAANPDWVWKAAEVSPTDGGFVLKWSAGIPVGLHTVHETGLDIVDVEA
ncbi:MAG: nuclear transport factor 2 family protein, partial [Candidatus Hydrogenedentes bacterium]|nr:nuclear transport factor 2 family protein [Candidatus Hydrogenedentota bacterium]